MGGGALAVMLNRTEVGALRALKTWLEYMSYLKSTHGGLVTTEAPRRLIYGLKSGSAEEDGPSRRCRRSFTMEAKAALSYVRPLPHDLQAAELNPLR